MQGRASSEHGHAAGYRSVGGGTSNRAAFYGIKKPTTWMALMASGSGYLRLPGSAHGLIARSCGFGLAVLAVFGWLSRHSHES